MLTPVASGNHRGDGKRRNGVTGGKVLWAEENLLPPSTKLPFAGSVLGRQRETAGLTTSVTISASATASPQAAPFGSSSNLSGKTDSVQCQRRGQDGCVVSRARQDTRRLRERCQSRQARPSGSGLYFSNALRKRPYCEPDGRDSHDLYARPTFGTPLCTTRRRQMRSGVA